MIAAAEREELELESSRLIASAGFPVTAEVLRSLEVADFGLGRVRKEGAQIYTIFETPLIACKLLVLLPEQVEPEHWHPFSGEDPGKEEVLTGFWGELYVATPGGAGAARVATIPAGKEEAYTCRNIQLAAPCESVTISPGTKHWFAAGGTGAVFLSTATVARFLEDRFTDPAVVRKTVVVD